MRAKFNLGKVIWAFIPLFIVFSAKSNTITTGVIAGSPFCACSLVNVNFTSTGVFVVGNNYTAQLSNAAGSFAAPVTIGVLGSNANAGIINAAIPCNTVTGNQYRIRVVSDNPATTGSDNGVNLTINAALPSSTSITASQNPICTGTSVTFIATNANGIPSPNYQWQLNGANVGVNSALYTNAALTNGNTVVCIISSAVPCYAPSFSNTIIMSVANSFIASNSISVLPNDTICFGDLVTITSIPLNGGPAPSFQWQINGGNVGAGTTTFSTSTLANGDVVTCLMTSSLGCATGSPAVSNPIPFYVYPGGTTSCNITAAPGNTICPGNSVTFTASPTNAGFTPSYQWFLNGIPVGTNSSTYTNVTLVNGDVITCSVTSSTTCTTGSPALSNSITMTVATTYLATVTVDPQNPVLCSGDSMSFFATGVNGGTNFAFQWQLNGTNIGANDPFLPAASYQNGDQLVCIFVSSDPCAGGSPAVSNIVTFVVDTCPPPTSYFHMDKKQICQEQCVTYTDSSINYPIGWHWFFEGGTPSETYDQNPPIVCYPKPGKFNVRLVTNNVRGFCDTTYNDVIEVLPPAVLDAGRDLEIQNGTSRTLQAKGGFSYFWSPAAGLSCTECQETVASPTETTTYILTDTLGCKDSDTLVIKVFDEFDVFVPTAFSPNGDGINDVLYVRGNGIKEIDFIVYDRIGEKVFMSASLSTGWDGSFRGKLLNPGVFSFFVKAFMSDGTTKSMKGNVTLFK